MKHPRFSPTLFFAFGLIGLISCGEPESTHGIIYSQYSDHENDHSNIELTSHLYIQAHINDSIYGEFLFDSGGNELVLDKDFVYGHDLENHLLAGAENAGFTHGVGEGKTRHYYLDGITITVDSQQFYSEEVRMIALDSLLGKSLKHRIDGIIGYDLFRDHLVQVDFDLGRLQLHTQLSDSLRSRYQMIDYEYAFRKPFIMTQLVLKNGDVIPAKLLFDMGSGKAISLTQRKARHHHLFERIDSLTCEDNSVGGMGGRSRSCYGMLECCIVAGLSTIKEVEVDLSKDQQGALGNHDMYDGLFGMDLIKQFNLIIDQQNQQFYLRSRQASASHM